MPTRRRCAGTAVAVPSTARRSPVHTTDPHRAVGSRHPRDRSERRNQQEHGEAVPLREGCRETAEHGHGDHADQPGFTERGYGGQQPGGFLGHAHPPQQSLDRIAPGRLHSRPDRLQRLRQGFARPSWERSVFGTARTTMRCPSTEALARGRPRPSAYARSASSSACQPCGFVVVMPAPHASLPAPGSGVSSPFLGESSARQRLPSSTNRPRP